MLDTATLFLQISKYMATQKNAEQIAKFADMFSAMGTEARLSHHLDKLRNEDLVSVRRESTFLHYTANTQALQELLGFLYAECCTRNKAVAPRDVVSICK